LIARKRTVRQKFFLNRSGRDANRISFSHFSHALDEPLSFEVVVLDFSDAKIDVAVHSTHAASLQSDCIRKDKLVLVCEVPIDQKRKLERHKKRKEHDKVAADSGVGEPVNQHLMLVAENVWRGGSFVVADDRLS